MHFAFGRLHRPVEPDNAWDAATDPAPTGSPGSVGNRTNNHAHHYMNDRKPQGTVSSGHAHGGDIESL